MAVIADVHHPAQSAVVALGGVQSSVDSGHRGMPNGVAFSHLRLSVPSK
jgi:hypothetical protein